MSASKETVKEDQKRDDPVEICQAKSVQIITKRKVLGETNSPVKQLKMKEEKPVEAFECSFCNKTLKFFNNFSCRCQKTFCSKHRFFDQHNCTFDFKNKVKSKLSELNPKVIAKKIHE